MRWKKKSNATTTTMELLQYNICYYCVNRQNKKEALARFCEQDYEGGMMRLGDE